MEYSILASNGSPGQIYLDDEDEIDLNSISGSLTDEKSKYDCSGCVNHFGSCSVLRAHAKAEKFREQVGAACVSGYTTSVDLMESWAFDLMYLALMSELLETKKVNADTLKTLQTKIESKSKPEYSGLAVRLGFKMIF